MVLDPRVRERLNRKLARVKSLRPLSGTQVAKLRTQMEIELTYHSNAIEGNKLTLRETQLVIQEGITIKGKPLRDHLEAKDHKDAVDFLYEVADKRRSTISALTIRELHHLITRE